MLLGKRLSLSTLIHLCRTLRHCLGAGLTVRDVFRQQARSGPAALRPLASRVDASLARGRDLHDALKEEEGVLGELFVSLGGVGEETGMLPEVFADLERYYVRQQKLRSEFVSRITWPIAQLVGAVLVITLLIFFMGIIADRGGVGGEPYDPLGLGLVGGRGAMIFLGCVAGFVLVLLGTYLFLTRVLRKQVAFSSFLLWLPGLGPCLRSLAIARFSFALRLTYETAMPIANALMLSLRATGNPAFQAKSDEVISSVRAGRDLTTTLQRTGLFPDEYEHIIAVAEESGQLSEVLRQQAEYYHEEAGRQLQILARVASFGVWLFVAVVIIIAIFRIFGTYLNMLDKVGK